MSRPLQLLLLLVLAGTFKADAASGDRNNVTDGPHSCGGVDVPYPFGIVDDKGKRDFRKGFEVICDAGYPGLATTGGDGKPVNISYFSIEKAEATVRLPVAWQCYNSSGNPNGSGGYIEKSLQFNGQGVYRISNAMNYLFVLGCATLGFLQSNPRDAQLAGCACYCNDSKSATSRACSGVGCCHADIPLDLIDNFLYFRDGVIDNGVDTVKFSPCDYAFLAEKDYYSFNTTDLHMDLHLTPRLMPVRLDWAIRDSLTCKEAMKNQGYACVSSNSRCLNSTNGAGYICSCLRGYEGNPYVLDGCTDINECEHPGKYPCRGVCKNKNGSYECVCEKHSRSTDPFKEPCRPNFKSKITIGSVTGAIIIVLVVFYWILHEEKRKIKEHYKKNGGPILKDYNYIMLFTKEDLKKILKRRNVIGRGHFGKVYMGHIKGCNEKVAVKETIAGKSADREQFVNEIRIQCQVNHKNIVKLVGCCLEVDVPILVYEFVPKGSLDVILHGANMMPLDMGQRLKIAAESAEGLAYMHSKIPTSILHGDVKPANILIDDDFMPKISDFGISRLIATDKQHTDNIIGDIKYMDPVILQTGRLTNKSDVYSFGVVLVELITRKKASCSDNNGLLKNFLEAYTKEKSVIGLVDKELAAVDQAIIDNLAGMIVQCLDLNVDQRPEMICVAEFLRDMVKRYLSK